MGNGGMTASQRLKVKKCRLPIVEFGEKVMYEKHVKSGEKKGSLEAEFAEGVYLGVKPSDLEYIIGDRRGDVVYSRTIRRQPMGDRWSVEWLKGVKRDTVEPEAK